MNAPAQRAVVLTPPGTGAIAMIRVTGTDPLSILRGWLPACNGLNRDTIAGRLVYSRLMDGDEVLDDVLVSVDSLAGGGFAIDIFSHGGIRIVQRILERLTGAGVIVDSGPESEYWSAASLIELEAIEAIGHARTRRALLYAARLRNELPGQLKQLGQNARSDRKRILVSLDGLTQEAASAQALLRGVRIALIGPPNSGKSTLFNQLVGRPAAVISSVPGTTRDWISEVVEFSGLPVELWDTAGHHASMDSLEIQAIQAGAAHARHAHGAVVVLDGSLPIPVPDIDELVAIVPKIWVVANKSDLGCQWNSETLQDVAKRYGTPAIALSARTGEGCEILKAAVLGHFGLADPNAPTVSLFTSRQLDLAHRIRHNPDLAETLMQELLGGSTGVESH